MSLNSLRVWNHAMLAVMASLLGAAVAQAQETTKPVAPVATVVAAPEHRDRSQSWYIQAYTGGTQIKSTDLHLIQPKLGTDVTYHDVAWNARQWSGSPYYGIRVGYYLPKAPRVAFEFEYNHAKMYAKVEDFKNVTGVWQGNPINSYERMSDKVKEYRITNGINTWNLNVLYRVPVQASEHYPDGRWQPYAGAGVGRYFLYSINDVGGIRSHNEYHPSGWGYQFLTGIRYLATPRLGLFVEGKYQHGDASSILADAGDDKGGRGYTDIRLLHLSGGLYYGF